MKKIIADSSSLILLHKCYMLGVLLENYKVVIPTAVFEELTVPGHEGAESFRENCAEGLIEIAEVSMIYVSDSSAFLHRGESEVISLFSQCTADFVLIDDGRGGGYCRDNGIPYINALLAVKILFIRELISEKYYSLSLNWLLSNGRYSKKIISFAEKANREILEFFI